MDSPLPDVLMTFQKRESLKWARKVFVLIHMVYPVLFTEGEPTIIMYQHFVFFYDVKLMLLVKLNIKPLTGLIKTIT